MTYRLTFTIDREAIYTDILTADTNNFTGLMEHAIQYLEDTLTEDEFLGIQAINVMVLNEAGNGPAVQ